jgi:hypothetical protein
MRPQKMRLDARPPSVSSTSSTHANALYGALSPATRGALYRAYRTVGVIFVLQGASAQCPHARGLGMWQR